MRTKSDDQVADMLGVSRQEYQAANLDKQGRIPCLRHETAIYEDEDFATQADWEHSWAASRIFWYVCIAITLPASIWLYEGAHTGLCLLAAWVWGVATLAAVQAGQKAEAGE